MNHKLRNAGFAIALVCCAELLQAQEQKAASPSPTEPQSNHTAKEAILLPTKETPPPTQSQALQNQTFLAGAATPTPTELQVIRQMIAMQSRQIEILTQQVERLNQVIERSSHIPSPDTSATPPVQETNPNATLAGTSASTAEAPRAEAVEHGATHVVTQGETLTSIAKQYKVSVVELIKVNNIQNDRTLQIGRTLTIPAPKSNDSPTPKEKK